MSLGSCSGWTLETSTADPRTGWTSQQTVVLKWDRLVRLMRVRTAASSFLPEAHTSPRCASMLLTICLHIDLPASVFICHLTLSSHRSLLLKVLIHRSAVELLRQTEAAALGFASELRETEEREMWWADSSMFKEGVLSGASGTMSGVLEVHIGDGSHSMG